MQHPASHVDTSEFGNDEQFFHIGKLSSSFESNQLLVEQIKRDIDPKFQEIIASFDFYNNLNIFTTVIGEYEDWSYLRGGQFLFKTRTIGIVIKICNFSPKRNEDPLKCIEIRYIKEDKCSGSEIINIETLRPTFGRLIFTDLESVIFAINKILQEIFYQPMVDRIVAQRVSILSYREAIMRERINNKRPIIQENFSSIVLGAKNKEYWIRHIASFLGNHDAGDYFI
jgi:hypothetical protein